MCGRFSFATSKEKLIKSFPDIQVETIPVANFNIAPTQKAVVITNEQPQVLQNFRWGLLAHWAKNDRAGGKLINARAETVISKPSFRIPIRKRRCLVVADSFYEWRTHGKTKIPFRITHASGQLLAFAGIWDYWNSPAGVTINSFAIITTSANKEMSEVHERMPVILDSKELQDTWLAETDLDTTLSLMRPLTDNSLEMYRISPAVNSVNFNSKECHKPHNPPLTLFDQF